jgi:plastocyanin
MRRFLVPAVLTLVLAFLGFSAWSLSPGGAAAEDQTIDVGNLYFCSAQFQDAICETSINAGDTVTWDVSAGFHTVTECDDSYAQCPPSGGFDSGQLGEGGTFSQTFAQSGSFEYYCAFHPTNMRGVITVAAAQATPTAAPTTPAGGTVTAAPTGGATQAAATSTVGSLPSTGGDPAGDHGMQWLGLTLAGLALLGASGGFALAVRRK